MFDGKKGGRGFLSKHRPACELLDVMLPFYATAQNELNLFLNTSGWNQLVNANQLRGNIEASLRNAFIVLMPLLLVDLHLRRSVGQLVGTTSRQRFESYIDPQAAADRIEEMSRRHPGAFRAAREITTNTVNNFKQIIERFAKDISIIGTHFNEGTLPKLVEIILAGDAHEGGSTSLLRLDSGRRLVYKARSSASDSLFAESLSSVDIASDRRLSHVFQIDRNHYSWHSFVSFYPSNDINHWDEFGFRLGKMLALLYFLSVTDIHFENVIANRGNVYCIDLESAFHPDVAGRDSKQEPLQLIGVLPSIEPQNGFDLSVLGVRKRLVPGAGFLFDRVNIDEMKLVQVAGKVPPGRCLTASLTRLHIHWSRFVKEFSSGFSEMYSNVGKRKKDFVEIIQAKRKDRFRVILKSTATYQHRLTMQALQFFRRPNGAFKSHGQIGRVELYEDNCLNNLRIPRFLATPFGYDVFTGEDKWCGKLIQKPGLAKTMDRLRRMGASDLSHQLRCIQNALRR